MFTNVSRHATLLTSLLAATSIVGCADTESLDPSSDLTTVAESGERDEATAVLAQQRQGSNPIKIRNVEAFGTGCPAGSWNASVSDDGEVFTLTFAGYEAGIQPGSVQTEQNRDCQLSIDFAIPAGFSANITEFSYMGYVNLSLGSAARVKAMYNWAGLGMSDLGWKTFVGPADQTFIQRDQVSGAHWSACGGNRPLLINTNVGARTTTPSGSAYINLSSLDAQTGKTFSLRFRIASRRC